MFPSPDPRVFCLLEAADADPRLAAGVPPPGLLSRAERERFERFVVPKRRQDWLLGRWTAKHLVQSYLIQTTRAEVLPERIEILADEDGAPYAYVGERLALSLSISHSGAESLCAVCAAGAGRVGADIEQSEPRETSFVRQFFTPGELAAIDRAEPDERDLLVNAQWSAKESVLKALRLGLRADTRQVDIHVSTLGPDWSPVSVTLDPALLPPGDVTAFAWCRVRPAYVLSLALLSNT